MSKKSRRRRQVQAPPWGSPDVVRDEEGVREYDSGTPEEMLDPIKFKLDGYTYVCRELGALELSEIARMHGRPADSPESIAFMAELFETLLGQGQYREFRQRCGQFQTKPERFVSIIQGVFEDFANRRSGEQSDSSDGSATIQNGSGDDSSLRAMQILEERERPDLQQAVVSAQRARAEREAEATPIRRPTRNRLGMD